MSHATIDQHVIDQTTDGRYRVVLHPDNDAESPDWDAQGYVFRVSYRRGYEVETLAEPTGDPFTDDIRAELVETLDEHGTDWDKVTERLRDGHDVVSVDRYDTREGDTLLCVVTDALCTEWGIPAGAPIRAEAADLTSWRDWHEGEVYGYVVQKLTRWQQLGTDDEPVYLVDEPVRETWEDTDESCWGLYGHEYALESAREALARESADD